MNSVVLTHSRNVWDLRPEHSRAARYMLQWTITDLARASGVAQQTIGRFERELGEITVSNLRKLVAAFEEAGVLWQTNPPRDPFVQCEDGVTVSIRPRLRVVPDTSES